jgi:quercetin dioxygenase-like cupin family protein
VMANASDVHAVVVVFPGGREGAARAGALPTPAWSGATRALPAKPIIIAPDKAKTYGPATIYFDSATGAKTFAAEILTLQAGAQVAEHVHAKETELLYILEGEGTMTVAGVQLPVTATSVVQVPPNTKHAFAATTTVRAVQLYTPGGPEQRFKAVK